MIYGGCPDSDLWHTDHINIGPLVDFLGCHVECACKNRCVFYILVNLDDLMPHKYITFYHPNVGVVMSQKTVLVLRELHFCCSTICHQHKSIRGFDSASSLHVCGRLWFPVFQKLLFPIS